MSIKPEFSLRVVKESFQVGDKLIKIGAFVARLYWKDYSLYQPSGIKLEGCHIIYHNRDKRYDRVCEFVVTSWATVQRLASECGRCTHWKLRKFINEQTAHALLLMRGFAKLGHEFVKPIIKAVKQVVAKATSTFRRIDTVRSIIRLRTWNDCKSCEDVQHIFDRTPSQFRTDGFVAKYLAAWNKFAPQAKSFPILPDPWMLPPLAAKPQLLLCPAEEVQRVTQSDIDALKAELLGMEPGLVEPQPTLADYKKVVDDILKGKSPCRRLKEVGFKLGLLVKGQVGKSTSQVASRFLDACVKNAVSLQQLRAALSS